MKYRKKPVVVEAFKWTGGQDQAEDPEWIVEAIKNKSARVLRKHVEGELKVVLGIKTLEGVMEAQVGDYIVKGANGETYPCEAGIFEQTYEYVGKTEIKDTFELAVSSDYKDRFIAEYLQLFIRVGGLTTMLNKYKDGTLDFTPTCSIELLQSQLDAMLLYAKALDARAEVEGIDVKRYIQEGN